MAIINYAQKVINFKVVYYGPGVAGKTANLQHIHKSLPDTSKGSMISLAKSAVREFITCNPFLEPPRINVVVENAGVVPVGHFLLRS